ELREFPPAFCRGARPQLAFMLPCDADLEPRPGSFDLATSGERQIHDAGELKRPIAALVQHGPEFLPRQRADFVIDQRPPLLKEVLNPAHLVLSGQLEEAESERLSAGRMRAVIHGVG